MSTKFRQQEIEHVLKELPLDEREMVVFLAILGLGKVSASEIAKKVSDIPRTSVYDVLASLKKHALVSTVIESGTALYQIAGIEHMIDNLEEQKREIADKQNKLRSVADMFTQLKSGNIHQSQVRFFEGKRGILAVHREIQNARMETRTFVDIEAVSKTLPRIFFEDNLQDFQTYKILKRDLMVHSREAERYLRIAPITEFHQVKWLPSTMQFETDTLVWGGHVAILDYSSPLSAVIIDNPIIAKTFVAWFEMMWKML
ncbi:MAG: hypothetical protein HYV41_04820 [Candidatus Magasanikbacteria bacterium]|nr:hypothetical protein [Candidatus Magasanikbacteria bacterium]